MKLNFLSILTVLFALAMQLGGLHAETPSFAKSKTEKIDLRDQKTNAANKAIPPVCKGNDLVLTLSSKDKQLLNKTAAQIVNGKGRFWKIEKLGTKPSWLLGTMHITDPRVVALSSLEQNALDHSDRVALELKEITDANKDFMTKMLAQNPSLFMIADGKTLKDLVPTSQFKKFRQDINNSGLSYNLIAHTKPWFTYTALSIPGCEIARQAAKIDALD